MLTVVGRRMPKKQIVALPNPMTKRPSRARLHYLYVPPRQQGSAHAICRRSTGGWLGGHCFAFPCRYRLFVRQLRARRAADLLLWAARIAQSITSETDLPV